MSHSTRSDRDRGIILVWFAAFVIVLLGSGALVIDLGSLLSERRQLQNGADAAAMAVAIDCAETACTESQLVALNYAQLSATDGEVSVSLCGIGAGLTDCSLVPGSLVPAGVSGAMGYVQALTSTLNRDSGESSDQVRFVFAPLLDALQVGQTVRARATVAWGPLGTAMVLPIVISKCAFESAWIAEGGSFPITPIRIGVSDTTLCSQGWTAGFDFLKDTVGDCGLTPIEIDSDGTTLDAGSEGLIPDCRPIIEALWASGETFIVLVAESRTDPGQNSTYLIDGFVSFTLCGFALKGGYNENSCLPDPAICAGNIDDVRICGTFQTGAVAVGLFGGGGDYGTRVVRFVG